MHSFPYCSVICRQVILLALSCRILALTANNKSFGPTPGHVSSTSGILTTPSNIIAEARLSDSHPSTGLSGLSTTTDNGVGPNSIDDEEGVARWIVVIVCVVCGFVLVSCILCALKIHRWRKDQGTYSIWNEQEPNVESMYARESGVLFEKLDIESSLSEDQCYEIPVDSFVTPQRIYIGGSRVTHVKENIGNSIKNDEKRMSELAKRMAVVDETEYCAATERLSRTSDATCKTGSPSNSVSGEASQLSSVSYSVSSLSDHVPSPGLESPKKESYSKPLPIIVTGEPVTCETYQLNRLDQERVNKLVNRPLPDTPLLSPPLVISESASLDRSLLKRRQEEKSLKPNVIFRTLPRPRKIRQLPIPKPLLSAISRSISSADVGKEARLNDHVASDPNDCTLTRVKKRLSQSLDNLLSSQRNSHYYENPYMMLDDDNQLMEERGRGGDVANVGFIFEPPYARVSTPAVSEENLPRDKEHLYARISTCIGTSDDNLNRHSYASVHHPVKLPLPVLARSASRHTYIKVIFGSEDSVFRSPSPRARDSVIRKSRSCSDMSSMVRSLTTGPDGFVLGRRSARNRYVNVAEVAKNGEDFPHIQCTIPHNLPSCSRPYENCPRPVEATAKCTCQGNMTYGDHLIPFPKAEGGYVNLNDTLDASPEQSVTQMCVSTPYKHACSVEHHRPYENVTNCNECLPYSADASSSTTKDILEFSKCHRGQGFLGSSNRNSESSNLNECHYGVPKTPARPLNRFSKEPLGLEDDRSIDNRYSRSDVLGINRVHKNPISHQKTLSAYLEERLIKGLDLQDGTGTLKTNDIAEDYDQKDHIYENYFTGKRQSCASNETSSSHDKLSSTSSLGTEEKSEVEPLIPRNTGADVNGNSVYDRFMGKLELRRNSFGRSTLCGESQA